jgi:hypothetical protein
VGTIGDNRNNFPIVEDLAEPEPLPKIFSDCGVSAGLVQFAFELLINLVIVAFAD